METTIEGGDPTRAVHAEMTIAQQRDLPQCIEERARQTKHIWKAIEDAQCNGRTEALFDERVIAIAVRQLDQPVAESLWADPQAAEKIREGIKKLGLGLVGRWDKAIKAHKSGKRAQLRAERQLSNEITSAQYNPEPIAFEVKEGETALGWASDINDSNASWLQEMLSRMNAEHAVVPTSNGAVRYLQRTKDIHGNDETRFLRPEDFHRLYAHISFNLNGKRVTASQAWERWVHRKQYSGIGMFPGSEKNRAKVPAGFLNLWKGFAIEPKQGDWSKFSSHLFSKVCQENEEHYFFLMDWLAHVVQKPQEKPGTCVVLKSAAEGTGKSVLSTIMKQILGEHALSVSKPDQIVGRFNGHLSKTVLLTCEEALWAGDRQAEGALKNLITESDITIEQKGLDAYSAPNYTRLLMLSNNDWVVPVGLDPRRYFVLEVVNKRAGDPKYFAPLFKQMDEGGTGAMLYDLLEWEVTSNLRHAPSTAALREQRAQSISGVERWLLDVAEAGGVREMGGGRVWLSESKPTEVSTDIVRDAAKEFCGPADSRGLDRTLGRLLKKIGVERVRLRGHGTNNRGYCYTFPPVQELKASVANALRVSVDGHEEGARPTIH